MSRGRQALAVLAWAFVGGIIFQVFLAGVGLFGVSSMLLHVQLGYWLPLLPLLMLLAAWPARPARPLRALIAILAVMTIFQTVLPGFRLVLPAVAALHPPNALLIFALAVHVGRRSISELRSARTAETVPAVAEDPVAAEAEA